MQIDLRDPTELKPYAGNPRDNDAAVDAVCESIREFGFRQPVVVDEDDVIIVGHTRHKAALKLGRANVPVHVARGLTAAQARAYRLADNQTAALSGWADDRLAAELAALQGEGFDLTLTGFSAEEIDALLAPRPAALLGDPDDVPEPPTEPVTRPGDLWVLGRHRLVCGDAKDPVAVTLALDGSPADLLLTDPPYNVAYEGGTSEHLTIANDAMTDGDYRGFLATSFGTAFEHLAPGSSFYVWHADVNGLTTRLAAADAGMTVRQVLVWAKPSLVLGRCDYHWRHEPCLYGWKDGAAHTWLGDRTQTTVLEYAKPARSGEHPTMKPVELFAALIRNSCPAGGRVLDPFGGSGTALIAAEQEGRGASLIELDPRYCDVILSRFTALTGGRGGVLLNENGEVPYADVRAARRSGRET
jgi:site-specific DNA-methyltransferase (adenine-specific)